MLALLQVVNQIQIFINITIINVTYKVDMAGGLVAEFVQLSSISSRDLVLITKNILISSEMMFIALCVYL